MKLRPDSRIVDAERFRNGVLVTFEDGECALYPSELLQDVYPLAEETTEPQAEDV